MEKWSYHHRSSFSFLGPFATLHKMAGRYGQEHLSVGKTGGTLMHRKAPIKTLNTLQRLTVLSESSKATSTPLHPMETKKVDAGPHQLHGEVVMWTDEAKLPWESLRFPDPGHGVRTRAYPFLSNRNVTAHTSSSHLFTTRERLPI